MMATTMTAPEPGIYENVDFDTYLSWPYASQTVLKAGKKSMLHMHHAMTERIEPTDDMKLGTALHVAFLEPERMPERVVLWEGPRRAGAEWESFKLANAGKVILTKGFHDKLCGMVGAMRKHPEVRRWMSRIESVEVSGVRDLLGVRCKGRTDALSDDPIIDLKKVATADPHLFANAIVEYGYHIQAAAYLRIFDRRRFILMAVESEPPYDVVPYELDRETLMRGDRELNQLLSAYAECKKSGRYPGRSDTPKTIGLPEWATKGSITVGGKPVNL